MCNLFHVNFDIIYEAWMLRWTTSMTSQRPRKTFNVYSSFCKCLRTFWLERKREVLQNCIVAAVKNWHLQRKVYCNELKLSFKNFKLPQQQNTTKTTSTVIDRLTLIPQLWCMECNIASCVHPLCKLLDTTRWFDTTSGILEVLEKWDLARVAT